MPKCVPIFTVMATLFSKKRNVSLYKENVDHRVKHCSGFLTAHGITRSEHDNDILL